MGDILGTSSPQIQQQSFEDMKPLTNAYYDQINGRSPLAQAQFENMSNQSMANTKRSIASMTGVRGSQKASMMNNALASQQSQLAGTGAIMAAQERQQVMGSLGNILMGQHGMQTGIDQFNAEQQTKANQRFSQLLGTGLTAAGYAFGGPAGGMAAGAMAGGMNDGGASSGNVGMTNSTFFNKNPY
jgi:hypothetical protein